MTDQIVPFIGGLLDGVALTYFIQARLNLRRARRTAAEIKAQLVDSGQQVRSEPMAE